jgi:hypothetical protein
VAAAGNDPARPVRGDIVLRLYACLTVAVAVILSVAPPASAHVKTGALSTDFEARVTGFRPAAPGLEARTLSGDQRLELRAPPTLTVIVLGFLGEPFLRFSPAGVDANLSSPTATSTRVIGASEAVTAARVEWRHIKSGHTFAWHENRLRPMQRVRNPGPRARAVAAWSIPLVVDGRRTELAGTEWYASRPAAWPWLLASALLVAGAVFATRRMSRRMQRRVAFALLPLTLGAFLAAWFGTLLAGRVSPLTVTFAVAFALATALFLVIAVTAADGAPQLAVMGLIGALSTTFAVPEVAVFQHGFVLAALPGLAERLAVAIALVGGLMTSVVCAPAAADVLGISLAPRATQR